MCVIDNITVFEGTLYFWVYDLLVALPEWQSVLGLSQVPSKNLMNTIRSFTFYQQPSGIFGPFKGQYLNIGRGESDAFLG